jgi:hypothetical protein
MSLEHIREFNFQALNGHFAQLAPTLHSILRMICDVVASNKKGDNEKGDNEEGKNEEGDYIGRKIKRQHRHRNKGVILTTVLALCAFAHSNHVNSF